jgi:hypothetical protein
LARWITWARPDPGPAVGYCGEIQYACRQYPAVDTARGRL